METSELIKLLDADFLEVVITEDTRRKIVQWAQTHDVGSTRVAMGRFYTSEEYEAYRKRVLSTPLP